jgi:uncharacterized repeat protein (TIGR03833 family)
MSANYRKNLKPGLLVHIIEKHNQKSGMRTEGEIKKILTDSSHHPDGIEVKLTSGKTGRVIKIISDIGLYKCAVCQNYTSKPHYCEECKDLICEKCGRLVDHGDYCSFYHGICGQFAPKIQIYDKNDFETKSDLIYSDGKYFEIL